MNLRDFPARILSVRLVEITSDGRKVCMGTFTRSDLAETTRKRLCDLSPQLVYVVEPWHPEFPGISNKEAIRS